MKRILLFLPILAGLVGCEAVGTSGPDGENATFDGKYPVEAVATVGMVADIVREVGGQCVEVEQLMGTGVDPHLYKATRDDVQRIMTADLVFPCGLMLEGKMSRTLNRVGESKPVIAVSEQLDSSRLLKPEGSGGHYDPHVWMDIALWGRCVDVVAAALCRFDSAQAAIYRENARDYNALLDGLHAYALESFASIPSDRRVLVTSHDAFHYLGRAYGLEVAGVQGLSTESEAGLQRVNELVDMLVDRDIRAVFIESSVPRKSIEALLEGALAAGHEVKIGGELYSDAMGQAGTYEGTYVGMLDHNITTITRALGGTAPKRGWQGKLSLRGVTNK